MRYLPAGAQHIGARQYQQDSFGFADSADQTFLGHAGFLAVLCDGMGGMAHGDVASQTAVATILEAYRQKTPEETIPQALERSVRQANDQVYQKAQSLGLAEGIGTTVVAAVLHQESLYFLTVGDSGLFLIHDGLLQMVNRPHVYANYLARAVEMGMISQEIADRHPEREALTSFVGIEKLTELDQNTEPWPVRKGDTLLLASDGMFKTLEADEIVTCLKGEPQKWPDLLVECVLAKQRTGQDNVTVMTVTLADESAPPSVFTQPPVTSEAKNSDNVPKSGASKKWLWAVLLVLVLIATGAYVGLAMRPPRPLP